MPFTLDAREHRQLSQVHDAVRALRHNAVILRTRLAGVDYDTVLQPQTSALTGSYARSIRGAIRALWGGLIDYYQFWDSMLSIVNYGLTQAWLQGAAECGVAESELSPEERLELRQLITVETGYIADLATDIEQGSKLNGGRLGTLLPRADNWALRITDAQNQAKIMACSDQKLEWIQGATKEPCLTCTRLNGKIKRASYWRTAGVAPQNYPNAMLVCGGWNCQCILEPTDGAISKGPLPSTP